jgi:hypothetical protein
VAVGGVDLNGCEARVWRGCGAGCWADLRRATLNRQLLFWAARATLGYGSAEIESKSGWAKSPMAPVSAIGPRQTCHLWKPLLTGLCLAACCFVSVPAASSSWFGRPWSGDRVASGRLTNATGPSLLAPSETARWHDSALGKLVGDSVKADGGDCVRKGRDPIPR